jgi:hypothetical protein
MEAEPPKADPPKRKRRRFQFSLRTLMIFTLVVAVACGCLGKKIEQKRKELEAVEPIVRLGAGISKGVQTTQDAPIPHTFCAGLHTMPTVNPAFLVSSSHLITSLCRQFSKPSQI